MIGILRSSKGFQEVYMEGASIKLSTHGGPALQIHYGLNRMLELGINVI